ncbi:MAG: UxaA family hydrolase [Candidatus Latescibacterota bacterium]
MKERSPSKTNMQPAEGVAFLIRIHPDDNVGVATVPLTHGTPVLAERKKRNLLDDVEIGGRIALTDIPSGQLIIQYGESLGRSMGICVGQAITPERVERIEPHYDLPDSFTPRDPISPESDPPTFMGIRRPDGSVGTRNWILVVPTVGCCVHEAEQIAAEAHARFLSEDNYPHVDGVVALSHIEGCAFCQASAERSARVLANCIAHPNVAGAVLVSLGCERIDPATLWDHMNSNPPFAKPIAKVKVQDHGSHAAIRAGIEHIADMLPHADRARRVKTPASELILGLKCGGSDGLSGITANPALGNASDRLVRFGGASVITELSEFSGVERAFSMRATNRDLAENLMAAFREHKQLVAAEGLTYECNPSPGNQAGGLFNVAVKSRGAIAKSGNAPVSGILQYTGRIGSARGLHLLVCVSNDLTATSALVAAGAQVVCFTTGRGTAMGNPFAPVIKIATNTPLYNRMRCDMDVDAGPIAAGQETIEDVGERLFDEILAVASGKKTAAEGSNRREFSLWTLGPMI